MRRAIAVVMGFDILQKGRLNLSKGLAPKSHNKQGELFYILMTPSVEDHALKPGS